MANRFFLDMDGTLIDPRQRLYGLFRELAPESTMSFEEYWQHKRGRMTQQQLLRQFLDYSDDQIRSFHDAWMAKVEEPDRLALDVPYPGVTAFLDLARQRAALCLVTARQNPDRLAMQLRQLGWQKFFTMVLATEQRQSKAMVIRSHCPYDAADIMIGDTGEDILAGKELGMRTVAVSSGTFSEAILREYGPDRVIPTVLDLLTDESLATGTGVAH